MTETFFATRKPDQFFILREWRTRHARVGGDND